MEHNEMIKFRLLKMPCCSHELCWVNPRLPSYCPECGRYIFDKIKGCVHLLDDEAWLKYST